MNLEDPKIKAAFIRGYLNKQAESGLDKKAFPIAPLLSVLGSIGGQQLGSRYLTPKLVNFAEKQLAGRVAARGGAAASSSRLGRGYDNFLKNLTKPMGPEELTSRGAGAWAENLGMAGGGVVGGITGDLLESKNPNPVDWQQYQA
jgi:hypothetical protein